MGKFNRKTRNLRSNPFIYKHAVYQGDGGPAVILNDEGAIGSYNRGNRSLHHFLENSLPLVIAMPITLYIFPFPSFVLIILFCLGRILH